MAPESTPVGKIAYAFARAVVDGACDAAHAMLSSDLRSQVGPDDLARDFAAMIAYGCGPPEIVEVVSVDDMAGWKARLVGDVGWAYVAISGADYSEAVSVIAAQEDGVGVIRMVEWGRP